MSRKIDVKNEDVKIEDIDEQQLNNNSSEEEEDEEEEIEDDEEMDFADYEGIEQMEKMNFDFEAFPPAKEDLDGIEGLLTQIFLRADVDSIEFAKAILAQAPFGCVYKPAEECEDEEAESLVYGILSIVGLNGTKKFQSSICELLLARSNKFGTGELYKKLEKLLGAGRQSPGADKIGILINERMLHFPAQISAPAFASIIEDCKSMPKNEQFQYILAILKIRICQDDVQTSGNGTVASTGENSQNKKKGGKRKLGKAAKKRLMAAKLAEAEIIFDNPEEELLFKNGHQSVEFPYFQYPVESEVERGSKFHCIRTKEGRIYRPYRRVCLLKWEQFLEFANKIAQSNL